ncbi:hypothetical protein Q0590_07010 [Rhodocytophaga aerolata]|uniref:Protein BatD n=1 Tax=Rhodocytophaga aerolata TaxID=455078 RepID=A0ABT8R1N4_9BACT|nr:hypothetical protein [Rhodocytophaga aerolata]MDO1445995.1 hypothetical protein [Rhodocytophaga aerolata]
MKSTALFYILFVFACIFSTSQLYAQSEAQAQTGSQTQANDSSALQIQLAVQPGWSHIQEGQKIEFALTTTGGTGNTVTYALVHGKTDSMQLDSTGRFTWIPGFDFVDRLTPNRTIQVLFEARNENNEFASKEVEFRVWHVNRPPQVEDLKPFYVRYNVVNTYTIDATMVKDADNDPLVFVSIPDQMPEGAKLTAQGEFTWKPSVTQYNQLKTKPLTIEFYVEDQPAKTRTKGRFKIEATQMDLAPEISVVPKTTAIRYNENAAVNLRFYLSDPNGDNDIATFNFVSENPAVPKSALVQNTPNQYEFIWTPGYDFVKDPLDSLSFDISFFVIDKSQKRDEKTVQVTIVNTVNEEEKDRKFYTEYRTSLVRAWDLLEQLKDTEKDLKKKFNQARKGKKGRSVVNASLGAASGLSPVVIQAPTTQKIVSTVGGTTVMTMGTLEATEVIGRSTKDLLDRVNYVMEKRHEIQTKGDIFARKYALKSSRRRPEFIKDLDDFVAAMNLKGLVALELDAGWENKQKATDAQISKTFKDFNGEN